MASLKMRRLTTASFIYFGVIAALAIFPASAVADDTSPSEAMEVDFSELGSTNGSCSISIVDRRPTPTASKRVKRLRRVTYASGIVSLVLVGGSIHYATRPPAANNEPPVTSPVVMKVDPEREAVIDEALEEVKRLDLLYEKIIATPAEDSSEIRLVPAPLASRSTIPASTGKPNVPNLIYFEEPSPQLVTGMGTVTFSVEVSKEGKVTDFFWNARSGDQLTDKAIESAVRNWVFESNANSAFRIEDLELSYREAM